MHVDINARPDLAGPRPINLICKRKLETNPKKHILFVRTQEKKE